jgi:prepilin-type N-terminal cleavage/methylation domain-containing protein
MQRGVSLVEILLVLAIFSLLAAAAVNIPVSMAWFEVRGAAQVLASDISWLQQVTINSVSTEDKVVAIPELIMRQTAPYGYSIIDQNSHSIRYYNFPSSVIIGSNAYHLAFKTSGRPAVGSDLTFILKSTRDQRISRKVIVEMITGRVRIE